MIYIRISGNYQIKQDTFRFAARSFKLITSPLRRSSIQVGDLLLKNGTLVCYLDNFDFFLPDQ